jgi:hypothetical protein
MRLFRAEVEPSFSGYLRAVAHRERVYRAARSRRRPEFGRRQLVELSDDVATKVQLLFYSDAGDALRKR